MFNNSPFDDFTLGILDKSNIPVGIMVDKNFENAGKVFVPIFDLNDFYLVEYAKGLLITTTHRLLFWMWWDKFAEIQKSVS